MKTNLCIMNHRLLYIPIMIFLLSFYSCSKEKEQTSNKIPSGGNTDPQPEGIIYDAVVDADGHTYDAVLIGNKYWMMQNLRVTRYTDGIEIPIGEPDEDRSGTDPYRFVPNGDGSNVNQHGYLYNWPAVMHGANSSSNNPGGVQGICPHGWHVPSRSEWEQMVTYIGMQVEYQCNNDKNNVAKSLASTSGWKESGKNCTVGNNQASNNATHFSAYPSGRGDVAVNNNFTKDAYFWSCTKSIMFGGEKCAYDFELDYYSSVVYFYAPYKEQAMAVRCVRD